MHSEVRYGGGPRKKGEFLCVMENGRFGLGVAVRGRGLKKGGGRGGPPVPSGRTMDKGDDPLRGGFEGASGARLGGKRLRVRMDNRRGGLE